MQKSIKKYVRTAIICLMVIMVTCVSAGLLLRNIGDNGNDRLPSTDSDLSADYGNTTISAEDKTQWNLILVNRWNPLPDGYEVNFMPLNNGHAVDERCYPDLQSMLDDCRSAGLNPVICSSYRTEEKQEQLFVNQVNKRIAQGYSEDDAKTEARKLVAVADTSEHQLGLAVDIAAEKIYKSGICLEEYLEQ